MTEPTYQCNHCGHTASKEEEVHCWRCGIGEMIFAGKKRAEIIQLKPKQSKAVQSVIDYAKSLDW